MIVTKNMNTALTEILNYTIDEPTAIKTLYNLTTAVTINGTQVATVLPYTFTATTGVHEIVVTMSNLADTYTDKYCLMHDPSLYCSIITKLSTMKDKDRAESNLPYQYFLLDEGQVQSGCQCQCDNIKTFYKELKDDLSDSNCC
jgi:hypothetical protein